MHSHLPIRHLIRRVEDSRNAPPRRPMPEWLGVFVTAVAELFEPFGGVARAGFECLYGDDRWEISLFLGETERVGGAEDGRTLPVNFRFDIKRMERLFDRIDSLSWNAFPNGHICSDQDRFESFLTIEGVLREERISLQVHALAPEAVGPAMREHTDGRVELA